MIPEQKSLWRNYVCSKKITSLKIITGQKLMAKNVDPDQNAPERGNQGMPYMPYFPKNLIRTRMNLR